MINTIFSTSNLLFFLSFLISSLIFSEQVLYLSDAPEYIDSITQGWGETGWDVSAHISGQVPLKLQIGGEEYEKGIGHHAPGEIVIQLGGRFKYFECEVGVQKQNGTNQGSVVFQVFVDGEKRWESGIRKELDPPLPVRVNLNKARELRLVVKDAGDGIICDCANWADARLVSDVDIYQEGLGEKLDIAPFADVITCNPRRYDGARCSRIEEFPPEDVFLEEKLKPMVGGLYPVPDYEGLKCIGLRWFERRKLTDLVLEFANSTKPRKIEVEVWTGESPWQGKWQPVITKVEEKGDVCRFHIPWRDNLFIWKGTEKVRWVFESDKPVLVKRLSAYSNSFWDRTTIRLESERNQQDSKAEIRVYNGKFLESPGPYNLNWEMANPLTFQIVYRVPRNDKGDRTLLWIRQTNVRFCIAVEDVLSNPCVYVPEAGVMAVLESSKLTVAEYKRSIEGKQSVLDRVRMLPEQRFRNALEKIHRPVQDNGPTMLSLVCDNNKFIVQREGSVQFNDFFVQVRMGSGNDGIKRRLYNDWLPIPYVEKEEDGVKYYSKTFVAPFEGNKSICVSDFEIKNIDGKVRLSDFMLSFYSNSKENKRAVLERKGEVIVAKDGEKVLSVCRVESEFFEINDGGLVIKRELPPQSLVKLVVFIPTNGDLNGLEDVNVNKLLEITVKYWEEMFKDSMKIQTPEPLLNNLIKASQAHCLIASRSEGDLIAPWIASMSYGPLESEAHSIIYGMDLMGWNEFSRKGLEYFISKYNDAGYLTTGYTLMGTGWHLWTLAEHYWLTRDKNWLEKYANRLCKACDWIKAQCEKTKRVDINGEKLPEYGLMPPGVGADWNRFAYRFAIQAHFYAGLNGIGNILKEIDHPGADKYIQGAKELKSAILRAYEWNKERTPVLPLSNGKWILPYPPTLYAFGTSGEMFPGEDYGRSWGYDVELGPHHLIPLGVLDPKSKDAENIVQHMEDYWFLHSDYWYAFSGEGDYPEEENKKDPFNLGGFSKIQPYYTRIAETYALRDEVKPFIRAYFNAIPSLLNTENLSFWEHFHNVGAWNKTHETGWFLVQTRKMFVCEDKDTLTLFVAPFVPSYWLENGSKVVVENAPTYFGKVSYSLQSKEENEIEGSIFVYKEVEFKKVILRVRHSLEKPFKKVMVNDCEYSDWDSQLCVVNLYPTPYKKEENWIINCLF